MNKKQRCFIKRFAALVAALMLCVSLCVPCFASNNASTQKWVVAEERLMTNESGTQSTYFRLTPYVKGEVFPAFIMSHSSPVYLSYSDASGSHIYGTSTFLSCSNYPDWWRSAIPLGGLSYIQISLKSAYKSATPTSPRTALSNARFYFFDSNNAVDLTVNTNSYVDGMDIDGYSGSLSQTSSSLFPIAIATDSSFLTADSVVLNVGSTSIITLSSMGNVCFGFPINYNHTGIGADMTYLTNLSSDRLVLGVGGSDSNYVTVTAAISFWVGADKLPAGLKVGDEFPANNDAFDDLRDDLIKQFPELSEKVENGKTTIQGWNDTETVDTDLANTSLSTINALFQNLGQFLAIVSLMIFGAVVLRMLVRKAVDG